MDIQLNLFIPRSEYETIPNPWNNSADFQTLHGRALGEACTELGIVSNCWARVYEDAAQNYPTVLDHFNVSNPPFLLFVDKSDFTAIAVLKGAQITRQNILDVYNSLQEFTPAVDQNTGQAGYMDSQNNFVTAEQISKRMSQLGLMGLWLFNLNINLPWWAWAAIAVGGGVASLESRSKIVKWATGAGAVVAAGNAINKRIHEK